RTYVFSTDHKMIGKQFLSMGLGMLVVGGILALLVRWQLAWPETPVPGFGWVPEPIMFGGIIPPETYNAFFTMHATIIMLSSFFVTGGPAAGGWTSYAPLSSVPVYTGVTWGQHLWCISLIILGISSLMGSINYITTVINMRAPGMTWFRL